MNAAVYPDMTCCQIDYVCYIYLLQWNKSIWILSLWGDNVYGYDFKWWDVKKSESQNDWNRTIFWCSNFADFWVWSVVLWFSYTNTHACVSPRIHCICIPLWYLFFREQYTFILQTTSDVIDLTGGFYQPIFQYIFNGYMVLN